MRKKFIKLSFWSFVWALSLFVFSYKLYHYLGIDGRFGTVFYEVPNKPFVTELFAIWGVMFLFSGVINAMIAHIFFRKDKK